MYVCVPLFGVEGGGRLPAKLISRKRWVWDNGYGLAGGGSGY